MAAPVYGSSVYSNDGAGASPTTVTLPSCSSGDLLVMQYACYGGTASTPSGWTSLIDFAAPVFSGRCYVFYKIAGGSEPSTYSVTNSLSNVPHYAETTVITGAAATPINTSATATTGSTLTTTPNAPAVTTTVASTLILRFWWVVLAHSGTASGGETLQYQQPIHIGGGAGQDMLALTTATATGAGTVAASPLTIANAYSSMATVAVAPPAVTTPIADFTGTPTSGTASLSVAFTDTSANTPTAWAWDFGDGGTSTSQNPTHSYTTSGVYTVTLIASNSGGSDTKTRTAYITVGEAVVYASGGGIDIW
jgi:PKD repeat protein